MFCQRLQYDKKGINNYFFNHIGSSYKKGRYWYDFKNRIWIRAAGLLPKMQAPDFETEDFLNVRGSRHMISLSICHALMDHLTESGKPPAEVAKSNKRVHACIRRSAYS